MGEGVLATARLILRPPVAEDLPWLLEHINTEPVMRYLAGVRTAAAVEADLAGDIAAFASGGWRRWVVCLREGEDDAGEPVGRCGVGPIRSPAAPPALQREYEIGWTFAQKHWGKGYATEAAERALGFAFGKRGAFGKSGAFGNSGSFGEKGAFGELGLHRIYSQTSESNAGSTRMMHRLGFIARPELGYVDPDYPARDNPTTVWSLDARRG